MNYIYGPVKSRRLGVSLGVSITPYKFCPLDCVYCQLKNTTEFTVIRKEYIKADSVLFEAAQFLRNYTDSQKIDYISLSGSGEPLLNSKIKDIILGIKKITNIPVALITNSVLFTDISVRREILDVDLILPSLDAVTQDIFEKIDRPIDSRIRIEDIINSLIFLRQEFKGKIWLEIMIIRGINDSLEYARKLKEAVERINPDKVQLNISSRPPSEPWVKMPTLAKLKKIQAIIGEKCELI